jgi:hypothetical protein
MVDSGDLYTGETPRPGGYYMSRAPGRHAEERKVFNPEQAKKAWEEGLSKADLLLQDGITHGEKASWADADPKAP